MAGDNGKSVPSWLGIVGFIITTAIAAGALAFSIYQSNELIQATWSVSV